MNTDTIHDETCPLCKNEKLKFKINYDLSGKEESISISCPNSTCDYSKINDFDC